MEAHLTEIDPVAAEVEVGEFLHGLVRVLKPALVVETGTYQAATSLFLLRAINDNEYGRFISCDIKRQFPMPVPEPFFRECSSLDLPELREADLVFSDSDQNLRQQEYSLVKPGCVFVVHDTHRSYNGNPDPMWLGKWVLQQGGLIFPAGRGFGIINKV